MNIKNSKQDEIINKKLLYDIIEWDCINWGGFIEFIEKQQIDFLDKDVLEIGARNGGLSLYYALKGAKVTCSDLEGPTLEARKLHDKYEIKDKITYAVIDAVDIPNEYNEKFDFVTFKSVIGGVGSYSNHNLSTQRKCVESFYRCLKVGGKLLFADNMQASYIHRIFRQNFVYWGKTWHYETKQEIHMLMKKFKLIDEKYMGVLGCFGRNEKMREVFGKIDAAVLNKIFPDSWKYIGMYIYEKEK